MEMYIDKINTINNNSCFICFSVQHPTLYCPERLDESKVFLSTKIDTVLHKRFLELCSLEEQYFLGFTFPYALKYLKPLKVIKRFINCRGCLEGIKLGREYNIAVTGLVKLEHINVKNTLVNDLRNSKFTPRTEERIFNFAFFKAPKITIHYCTLSPQELLYLLSFQTEIFECFNLTLTSKLTFRQILQKVPKIKEIELQKTNVETEVSWPEDLYECKMGNNFKKLDITINSLNFNIDNLIAFMKTKSTQRVQISLYFECPSSYNILINDNEDAFRTEITEKFSAYFLSVDNLMNCPFLSLSLMKKGSRDKYQFLGYFILKSS